MQHTDTDFFKKQDWLLIPEKRKLRAKKSYQGHYLMIKESSPRRQNNPKYILSNKRALKYMRQKLIG